MSSFQSTHPVWDATRQERLVVENQDFNPRIPYGMRRVAFALATLDYLNFNPRIPYGMRPDNEMPPTPVIVFQSTHPVWDATGDSGDLGRLEEISIHASRMGCDFDYIPITHIPRFQSTHPVWDATVGGLGAEGDFSISIHASRMGCDPPHSSWLRARRLISIHASRMGCDYTPTHYRLSTWYFNPRIPYGMRPTQLAICVANVDFNPRIPYGMRRHSDHAQGRNHGFQSTHPVWDATDCVARRSACPCISIHASRMGCDGTRHIPGNVVLISIHASRMGCDVFRCDRGYLMWISIHASRMGCDRIVGHSETAGDISIHASRMGCDGDMRIQRLRLHDFNPRIPYGMRPR